MPFGAAVSALVLLSRAVTLLHEFVVEPDLGKGGNAFVNRRDGLPTEDDVELGQRVYQRVQNARPFPQYCATAELAKFLQVRSLQVPTTCLSSPKEVNGIGPGNSGATFGSKSLDRSSGSL
jgi:hypothetical protein